MILIEAVNEIQQKYKIEIQESFGDLGNEDRLYIIDNLYPLQRQQPDISEFPMLVRAGITSWGQIADVDRVVKWVDVYRYLEFLYLRYADDFGINIETFNQLIDSLFERGYSGFYCSL